MHKLGIIGFGIVGKSVLSFINKYKIEAPSLDLQADALDSIFCFDVSVWDNRALDSDEHTLITTYDATFTNGASTSLTEFIEQNDFIIASPGVNLNNHKAYEHKILCELDFFAVFFNKPTIAVTGSLGKTTITKLLGKLSSSLEQHPHGIFKGKLHPSIFVAGNIGVGMLDLIKRHDQYDGAVLELSSFQLEQSRKYAPDIAVWTNLYPNHLDRHTSLEEYFLAKYNLVCNQNADQTLVVSEDLLIGPAGNFAREKIKLLASRLVICFKNLPSQSLIDLIKRDTFTIFYSNNDLLEMA